MAPTIPTTGAGRILGVQTAAETGTTHTFPSLSSLTKNSGDLLIAIVFLYDGNTTNAEFSSWGGGFTEFGDFATTTTLSIGAAYKYSTGSETGTFTVTSSGAGRAALILMSIAGAHASTIPEAGGYATGVNANANPGSLNPAGWDVEDTLWIACAATGEDSTSGTFTGIVTAPTNYTNLFAQAAADDVVGSINAAVAFRANSAASEDPGTFSNDTSNVRWGGITIAVRPIATQTTSISPVTLTLSPVALTGQGDQPTSISPAIFTLTPVALVAKTIDPPNLSVNVVVDDAALTWSASTTPFVDDYLVFRRSPPTGADFVPGTDTPIATGVTTLSYDDLNLAIGTYEWQVFGNVGTFNDPTDLSGCVGWFDANDAGSITASAGKVSQWNDKSGAGNHATQSTSSEQPTTGTRTQNSKNVIDFDGSGDRMFTPSPFTTNDRTQSIFVVAMSDSDVFDKCILGCINNFNRLFGRKSGFMTFHQAFGSTIGSYDAAGMTNGVAYIWSVISSATNAQMGRNGAYETDTSSTTFTGGTDSSIIGGDQVSGNNRWDGWIAELVVYDRELTDTERDYVVSYLNTKWAVY